MKKLLLGAGLLLLAIFFSGTWLSGAASVKPLLIAGLACLALFSGMEEKWKGAAYSLWILTSVSAAMSYPSLFLGIGEFQFKQLIIPLLQIIMFGMGSQMSLNDLAGVISMPKGVIIGVMCQFVIMPVVGFSLASLFSFPPEIAAGIILVGSSPGGLASNVMSFIAKANLPLSITITAVATLVSPLMTPFLMQQFAGELIEINFLSMMTGIFNMVIIPICAGLIFNLFSAQDQSQQKSNRSKAFQMAAYVSLIVLKNVLGALAEGGGEWPISPLLWDLLLFAVLPIGLAYLFKWFAGGDKKVLDRILSLVSMVGIAVIIVVITAAGRDSLLTIGILLMIACLMHNLLGYAFGYLFASLFRLPEQDRRTIAIEVGMQNGGLASGLALQMGKIATVGLAPAVFGPMMNITGSSLASWWRQRPPKGYVEASDAETEPGRIGASGQ